MTTRRAIITMLGGAAAWPLVAQAQPAAMPVVGILSGRAPETDAPLLELLRQGLRETGFIVNQNVVTEYRWVGGHYDRLPAMAADLARRQVALIIAIGGSPSALAAKAATAAIPIVFVGGDPVKNGLVKSLSRPGGNITGVSTLLADLASKQLGLAYELLPKADMIAVLVNPTNLEAEGVPRDVETAAHAIGRQIKVLHARSAQDIDATFESLRSIRADGLLVAVDAFFFSQARQLVALAASHRVPTVFFRREFSDAGGLMSYGSNPAEAYRQVGIYGGRILKGEKPADLPVVQSTKFELVINLKTARTLGLEIPPTLLARADEVIE